MFTLLFVQYVKPSNRNYTVIERRETLVNTPGKISQSRQFVFFYVRLHYISYNLIVLLVFTQVQTFSPLSPTSRTDLFPSSGSYSPDIGEKVTCVLNKRTRFGVLRYSGRTHFAEGHWCGITLDKPCGKNDGSVRGVRYFQCESKHGIFVHSHKVGSVEDYWEWLCSQRSERTDKFTPAEAVNENLNSNNGMSCVEKQTRPDLSKGNNEYKAQRGLWKINKRPRSRSLDRCLLVKVKLSGDSGPKDSSSHPTQNDRLVRSVSLPKIVGNCYLVSVKSSSDSKERLSEQGNLADFESRKLPLIGNDDTKNVNKTDVRSVSALSNSEELDFLHSSKELDCIKAMHDHTAGHRKLGHTMSLDTHLRMRQTNGDTDSSANGWHASYNDEVSLGHSKVIDAFLEGQYSSCPSLVPSSAAHISEAIATCLDLGRADRELHKNESKPTEKKQDEDDEIKVPLCQDESLTSKKSDTELICKGSSASQTKLNHSSPIVTGVSQSKGDGLRSSWPCLSTSNAQIDAKPVESAAVLRQCLVLDVPERNLELSTEANETSSICSTKSDSQASSSSIGVCSTDSKEKLKSTARSCSTKAVPSTKLKRPDSFKSQAVSARSTNQALQHKKSVTKTSESTSKPVTRPSKLQLDKRLQKRHTLATLSDVKSVGRGHDPKQPSPQMGSPQQAAMKASANTAEVREGGKVSKLPMLRKASSPQIQPAPKPDTSVVGKTEMAPVMRRGSGLDVPSGKGEKPKAGTSSRDAGKGKPDSLTSQKSITRNAQTGKGSSVAKSTARGTSSSSSKVGRAPSSTPGV